MYPKLIFNSFSKREKVIFLAAIAIFIIGSITRATVAVDQSSDFIPVRGGTYREGEVGQPIAINPVTSSNPVDLDISAAIYSTLGDLLTNHDTDKDGQIHSVKIKEGLKWSNGTPLTSDDVIFTVRTIQNPDTKSPLFKNWEGVVVERISELQIRFTLQTSYAFFMENVEKLPIIPEHIFGKLPPANLKLSTYNLEPIGSGPYKFESFSKRKDGFIKEYRLKQNEHYHKNQPFLENVFFVFFETEKDLLQAFSLRQIDGFGSTNPKEEIVAQKRRGTVTNIIPMSRYYAIFFNSNINPILKNETTRTALRDAIDKNQIIEKVFPENTARVTEGPIIKAENESAPEKLSKDEIIKHIEKRKAVEERFSLNLVIPDVDFLEETAKIIKENWESIGIDDVNLIELPSEDLLENVIKPNNYEMILFGNIVEISEDVFPFWHSSERFYPGLNLSLYKNSEADTLMERIRQGDNTKEKAQHVKELEEALQEDVPAIFLYSLPYIHIHTEKLKGFETKNIIASPSERFKNIANWHTKTARIVKDELETQE
ncbi:hypothetical protein CL629_03150 [bacterium]|nr:hypothetical protein [bacterium]|tara:strand:+ start:1466 stop:3094 length:1629 start_codon:yes stop_codon:yes gene_type:complete